ncbi:MAG: hypothetical protein ABJK25_04160 [Halieaceae bacterium]
MRLHKPYALEHMRAEHIVIGSSRAASLPPTREGSTGYNAALPGIWMRELRLMVEHAQAINPLRSALIALDYSMFRQENAGQTRDGFAAQRLRNSMYSRSDTFANWKQRGRDHFTSLLSVDSLIESVRSSFDDMSSNTVYMSDGTWFYLPEKDTKWLYSFVNKRRSREFLDESGILNFEEFDKLLSFLQANQIETVFLISPFHGSVMTSVESAGKWEDYLTWQRRVVEAVSGYDAPFRVAGIESNPGIILEPIGIERPFFTDGMHFSQEAGKSISECIMTKKCTDQVDVHFLEPRNVHKYLNDIDALMRAYPDSNPGDFAALQRWLLSLKE